MSQDVLSSFRCIVVVMSAFIIILLMTSACRSTAAQTESPKFMVESPESLQKTATPIPAEPHITDNVKAPAESNLKMIPFKVGLAFIEQTNPVWGNIAFYYHKTYS